jgi:cell division protein FtsL
MRKLVYGDLVLSVAKVGQKNRQNTSRCLYIRSSFLTCFVTMEPQYEAERNDAERKRRIGFIIMGLAIVALLVVVGILYFRGKDEGQLKEEATSLNEQLSREKADLSKELAALRINNEEMDSALKAGNTELEDRAYKLDSLLKTKNLTVAQLRSARAELNSLRALVNKLRARIDSLSTANAGLQTEVATRDQTIEEERMARTAVEQERDAANDKVKAGSVLRAGSFVVKTYRVKGSGKETEGTKAKNVDHVRVCFELQENAIAPTGPKDVQMRVVGPNGTTLYIEDEGSGTFNMTTGEQTRYTAKTTVNYQNKALPTCITFNKGSDFDAGNYTVEVYSDGTKIGNSTFSLK